MRNVNKSKVPLDLLAAGALALRFRLNWRAAQKVRLRSR